MPLGFIVPAVAIVILVLTTTLILLSRYRKCPSDKILVKYGAFIGNGESAEVIHGGGTYVWPIIQESTFISLAPITIDIPVERLFPQEAKLHYVPGKFTVGVSVEPKLMHNAAERLLGLEIEEIGEIAREIIIGQLRYTVEPLIRDATDKGREGLLGDREGLFRAVRANVEPELNKVGLYLINFDII